MVGARKEAGIQQCGLERCHLQPQQLLLDGVGDRVVLVDQLENLGNRLDDQPIQRRAVCLGGGRGLLAHLLHHRTDGLGAVGFLGTGLQLAQHGHQLVGGGLLVGGHLGVVAEVARIGQIAGGLGQHGRALFATAADLVGPLADLGFGDVDHAVAVCPAPATVAATAVLIVFGALAQRVVMLAADVLGGAGLGDAVAQLGQDAVGDEPAVHVLVQLDQFDRELGLEQIQQERCRAVTGAHLVLGQNAAQHLEDDVWRDRVFVLGKPVLLQQCAEAGAQAVGQLLVHPATGASRNACDQQLVAHGVIVHQAQRRRLVLDDGGLRGAVAAVGGDTGAFLPAEGTADLELLLDAGLAIAQDVQRHVELILLFPVGLLDDALDQPVHHGHVGVAEAPVERDQDGLADLPQDCQVAGIDVGTGDWHKRLPGKLSGTYLQGGCQFVGRSLLSAVYSTDIGRLPVGAMSCRPQGWPRYVPTDTIWIVNGSRAGMVLERDGSDLR